MNTIYISSINANFISWVLKAIIVFFFNIFIFIPISADLCAPEKVALGVRGTSRVGDISVCIYIFKIFIYSQFIYSLKMFYDSKITHVRSNKSKHKARHLAKAQSDTQIEK